ncbi:MAG: DUF1583 domain-containing protein, partial [Fuerstiella sp.]
MLTGVFTQLRHRRVPEKYFKFADATSQGHVNETPAGVVHVQSSDGRVRQSSLNSWLRMQGDFDVTADFSDLNISAKQVCGAEMHVTFEGGFSVGVKRRWQLQDLHRLVVDWSIPAEPGTSTARAGQVRRQSEFISTEALGGRLRIARRGDTAYVLFAEYDSTEFRLVGSQTFKTLNQKLAQIRLAALANNSGSTRVTWKQLRVGADELLIMPASRIPPKPLLFVMNADGSNLRQITQPILDPAIHGHASPDWPPNGDLIHAIRTAKLLCTDNAVIKPATIFIKVLAGQIGKLNEAVQCAEKHIDQEMQKHPDAHLFLALPGAG